jgi:hypothetical protein
VREGEEDHNFLTTSINSSLSSFFLSTCWVRTIIYGNLFSLTSRSGTTGASGVLRAFGADDDVDDDDDGDGDCERRSNTDGGGGKPGAVT